MAIIIIMFGLHVMFDLCLIMFFIRLEREALNLVAWNRRGSPLHTASWKLARPFGVHVSRSYAFPKPSQWQCSSISLWDPNNAVLKREFSLLEGSLRAHPDSSSAVPSLGMYLTPAFSAAEM
jgi:hypothetical protein